MYRKSFIFLLFFALFTTTRAQDSFSDQIITIGEEEFMPYTRGVVHKDMEGDKMLMFEKIYQTISSWDSLNPPKGFEARFYARGQMLDLTFTAYLKEGSSKIVKTGPLLSLYFNDPIRALGAPLVSNIFLQPEKVADFFGYPVYQNTNQEVTVISKNKAPLFVPVTQGEYLQQLIENELEKRKNEVGSQQVNNSGGMLDEMEKSYKELLKIDPAAAVAFKIEIQKFKADMVNNATDIFPGDCLTSLKKELENLSPAESSKPAWYSMGAMEKYGNLSGLVPDTHAEEGTALVKMAPAYSNLVYNKNVIKLMVISWNLGDDNSKYDKPRFFEGEAKGFMLADYYMAKLYRQQKIWNNIIDMVQ